MAQGSGGPLKIACPGPVLVPYSSQDFKCTFRTGFCRLISGPESAYLQNTILGPKCFKQFQFGTRTVLVPSLSSSRPHYGLLKFFTIKILNVLFRNFKAD